MIELQATVGTSCNMLTLFDLFFPPDTLSMVQKHAHYWQIISTVTHQRFLFVTWVEPLVINNPYV